MAVVSYDLFLLQCFLEGLQFFAFLKSRCNVFFGEIFCNFHITFFRFFALSLPVDLLLYLSTSVQGFISFVGNKFHTINIAYHLCSIKLDL